MACYYGATWETFSKVPPATSTGDRERYIFKSEHCVHQRIAAKTLHISTSAMKQNEMQQEPYIIIQVQ